MNRLAYILFFLVSGLIIFSGTQLNLNSSDEIGFVVVQEAQSGVFIGECVKAEDEIEQGQYFLSDIVFQSNIEHKIPITRKYFFVERKAEQKLPDQYSNLPPPHFPVSLLS